MKIILFSKLPSNDVDVDVDVMLFGSVSDTEVDTVDF